MPGRKERSIPRLDLDPVEQIFLLLIFSALLLSILDLYPYQFRGEIVFLGKIVGIVLSSLFTAAYLNHLRSRIRSRSWFQAFLTLINRIWTVAVWGLKILFVTLKGGIGILSRIFRSAARLSNKLFEKRGKPTSRGRSPKNANFVEETLSTPSSPRDGGSSQSSGLGRAAERGREPPADVETSKRSGFEDRLTVQRAKNSTEALYREKRRDERRRELSSAPYQPPRADGIFLGCEDEETPSQYGILGRSGEDTVFLDLDKPHWIFVVGVKGSGKSYTLGVICEMLAERISQISVLKEPLSAVAMDNRGDFVTLGSPNTEKEEVGILRKVYGAHPQGIGNISLLTVQKVFEEGYGDQPFKIRPSVLDFDDWRIVLGLEQSRRPKRWFMDFLKSLEIVRGKKENYSIQDLIDHFEEQEESVSQSAILARLRYLKGAGVFDENAPDLLELIRDRAVVIIYTIRCRRWVRILLSSLFLRRLKEYCEELEIKRKRGDQIERVPNIWLVFDEAHFLLPARGETPFLHELEETMRIARHWGISVILATQNPDDVQDKIIGLCDLFIIHKITSVTFINKLRARVERDLDSKQIGRLQSGEATVLDRTGGRILDVSIRPRVSEHGGRTQTATQT